MKRSLALFCLFALFAAPASATQVKEVTSPGGITAWLVEEHALPLVAVKIAFRDSGFAYDPSGKEGLVTMTSALLLEGAGDLDSNAFNEALENKAIELNFGTDEDLMRASLECLSEHKEKAFSYLGMALTQPRFDSSAIDRVRDQTLSLIAQQEEEPGYIVHRKWQEVAFGSHPYGTPVLGTSSSVKKLERDDFVNFIHRYLTRENIMIAVVGDITPQELGKLLDEHLAALPQHYDPDMTVPDVTLPSAPQQEVVEQDIPQTLVMFGTQGIKRDDPDYYAGYVMNQILGGGGSLSAKLATEIREKRGLAYSVSSQLDPMMHGAVWRGAFSTRNEKVDEALSVLRATLKDFAANGPTDQELSDAKQFLTGSFVLSLDSNAEVANYLISMQLHHLGRDYLEKRNKLMSAVRKEDVARVAARLTDPAHLLVVMAGKPNLAAGQ